MKARYFVHVIEPDGDEWNVPLTALTDTSAVAGMRRWCANALVLPGSKAYLCFKRSDGMTGYLNDFYASYEGKNWFDPARACDLQEPRT